MVSIACNSILSPSNLHLCRYKVLYLPSCLSVNLKSLVDAKRAAGLVYHPAKNNSASDAELEGNMELFYHINKSVQFLLNVNLKNAYDLKLTKHKPLEKKEANKEKKQAKKAEE